MGMNRLKAEDTQHRIRSLVFNPDGPGGTGTHLSALEANWAPGFNPESRKYFDMVDSDPRASDSALQCYFDAVGLNPRGRNQHCSEVVIYFDAVGLDPRGSESARR